MIKRATPTTTATLNLSKRLIEGRILDSKLLMLRVDELVRAKICQKSSNQCVVRAF